MEGGKPDGSGGGEALPAHSQTSNRHAVRSDPEKDACAQPGRRHTRGQATDGHTVRPRTGSPETVAHVFTQSGNKGGRMQNQTNKSCTWSDRTRGQARSQTSDTGGQRGDTRGDVVGRTTLLQGQAGRQPSGRKPEKHGQARRPPGGRAGGGGARRACGRQARGVGAQVCGAPPTASQILSPTGACTQTTGARQAQPAGHWGPWGPKRSPPPCPCGGPPAGKVEAPAGPKVTTAAGPTHGHTSAGPLLGRRVLSQTTWVNWVGLREPLGKPRVPSEPPGRPAYHGPRGRPPALA